MIRHLPLKAPQERQQATALRWLVLLVLILGIVAIFGVRTALARTAHLPRLFELFDLLTALASALVLAAGYRALRTTDWLAGIGIGLLIGLLLPLATLFSPYPFLDLVHDRRWESVIRGGLTAVTALGGLVIMRWGGPVQVRMAQGEGRRALLGFGFGALVGLPLAILNAYANAWTQGRAFSWQSPGAAALDALQPGVVEEVIYRLAFLGLLWLILQRTWPDRQAAILAGALALLVHTYGHFSELLVEQPWLALGMGAVLGLLWGVPPTILALRRDLEASIGFHWVQDFARFWAGL
jgi:hypothetical protein